MVQGRYGHGREGGPRQQHLVCFLSWSWCYSCLQGYHHCHYCHPPLVCLNRSKIFLLQAAPEGSKKYESSRESCYWKIGVCVPDVDLARDRITRHGVSVSSPSQFMDVGYLCHLSDPSGFTIELLQHTFQQNFVKPAPDDNFVLGQVAVIGQITTRSTNIEVNWGENSSCLLQLYLK